MSNYEKPEKIIGRIDETKVASTHEFNESERERDLPQDFDECIQRKWCPCCFLRDKTITSVPDGAMSEGCCRTDQRERDRYRQGGESWQSIMARYGYEKDKLKEEYGNENFDEVMSREDYHSPFTLHEIKKQLEEVRNLHRQKAA